MNSHLQCTCTCRKYIQLYEPAEGHPTIIYCCAYLSMLFIELRQNPIVAVSAKFSNIIPMKAINWLKYYYQLVAQRTKKMYRNKAKMKPQEDHPMAEKKDKKTTYICCMTHFQPTDVEQPSCRSFLPCFYSRVVFLCFYPCLVSVLLQALSYM